MRLNLSGVLRFDALDVVLPPIQDRLNEFSNFKAEFLLKDQPGKPV